MPSDFLVVERLGWRVVEARSKSHALAVYALRKDSLTTPEAVHWLAKALGVRDGMVSHAGLKDKHAVTVQHLSVRNEASKDLPKEVSGDNGHGWSARLVGWSERELTADAIEANEFTIVARDLTSEAAREMDRRTAALTVTPNGESMSHALVLINYFGDQRFGSARHGEGWIAEHFVRGEFESALKLAIGTPARKDTGKKRTFTRLCAGRWGDWAGLANELPRCPERRSIEVLAAGRSFRDAFAALPAFLQQFAVEAYQSHVWNEAVRRYVRTFVIRGNSNDAIVADDPFGEMVFPIAARVTNEMRACELGMASPTARFEEPWTGIVEDVLRERGLTLEGLRAPGLRRPAFGEASRRIVMMASEFDMSAVEHDELSRGGKRMKRTLKFVLPRGAYATVVMRALGG